MYLECWYGLFLPFRPFPMQMQRRELEPSLGGSLLTYLWLGSVVNGEVVAMPRVSPADGWNTEDAVTHETVIEVGELLSSLESTSDETTSAASAASTRGMRLRALASASPTCLDDDELLCYQLRRWRLRN